MKEEFILETERLYLRKMIPEKDAAFIVELMNSPKWLKYIGDRNVRTEEQAMTYINERVMKAYEQYEYGGYVAILKSTGERVGNCGLFKRPVLDHPDIGYALLPEHEGRGYAFEASQGVLNFARELKLPRVLAITVTYNDRSIHLLEKLGLTFERNFRMEGDPEELSLYGIDLTTG